MHHVLMFVSTIDSLLLNKTNFIKTAAITKSQLFGHTIICISMLPLYFSITVYHLTEIIQKCLHVFYKFRILDQWTFHISNVENHSRYKTPRQYYTNSQ